MKKKVFCFSDKQIMAALERHKKDFELEGVEFTDEDVKNTRKLLNNGENLFNACRKILQGIYDCLN